MENFCHYYDVGFGYGKDHNLTTEEVYKKVLNDLELEDDIATGLNQIWKKMSKSSSKYDISEFFSLNSKKWLFLEKIRFLFSFVMKYPFRMSTNFDAHVMELLEPLSPARFYKNDLDQVYNIFSLPGNALNLMSIGHFYTMNDFGQMGRPDLFSLINKLVLGGVPKTFELCFKQMHQEFYGSFDDPSEFRFIKISSPIIKSPCSNNSLGQNCKSYCDWHKSFFSLPQNKRKEFLSIMALSQPQRKLISQPLSQIELNLARKIFGATRQMDSLMTSSMPLVIFCKDRFDKDWIGDDFGSVLKFCSDFFPSPTDHGVCLSKNLDYQQLINTNEEFKTVFETSKQIFPKLIEEDKLNSRATFIINTNAGNPLKG